MATLNALLVEDDPDDADLLVRRLIEAGNDVRWNRVETESEFLSALQSPPDIIFSDYVMPRFSGLRALELLRGSGLEVPLILVSGTVGEDIAVEAMRLSATGYLLKDRTDRLACAVQRALDDRRLRSERQLALESLRRRDQRLRAIMEGTLDCIMVLCADGSISEINRSGIRMLEGDSLEALRARPFLDYVLPPYQAALREFHERILRGHSECLSFEVQGLKGGRRWLEMQAGPLSDANGISEALISISRNVTDRKADEAQIQEQLKELQLWKSVTLDREDRVLGLKKEVNDLLGEIGRAPRYASVSS